MLTDPTKPDAALEALRAALTQLRALAALPAADPFYAQAAEQVGAIVTGLEGRALRGGLDPEPPDPG